MRLSEAVRPFRGAKGRLEQGSNDTRPVVIRRACVGTARRDGGLGDRGISHWGADRVANVPIGGGPARSRTKDMVRPGNTGGAKVPVFWCASDGDEDRLLVMSLTTRDSIQDPSLAKAWPGFVLSSGKLRAQGPDAISGHQKRPMRALGRGHRAALRQTQV